MDNQKKLGIWMDHASAHLTEFDGANSETTTIHDAFTHEDKVYGLERSEKHENLKEQHFHKDYYKKIEEAIRNYDEVVLFGPTEAKNELHNLLKADHHFANIKIDVETTDKMNEHQRHAFVKNYFSKEK